MIVPMAKVFVASRSRDRQGLLDALGELGVLHIKPVDAARAVPDESAVAEAKEMERAAQVLAGIEPTGERPKVSAEEASREVLDIQRRAAERQNRLASLHNQLQQIAMWGDVEIRQFEALKAAGLDVQFVSVPLEDAMAVRAECVQELGELPSKRVLMAAIDRTGTIDLPESAEKIPLPPRDAPSIRAEAAELDEQNKQDAVRLAELAGMAEAIQAKAGEARLKLQFDMAGRSGIEHEQLCALQGWVPAGEAGNLGERLAEKGLEVATKAVEPEEDETPPTLIRYPGWARPIKGLFDILNTLPGYREMDLSVFFMFALPLFAAILIGDGGYGLLFTIIAVVMRGKLVRIAGREKADLVLIVGIAALIWGMLTANYFGISPDLLTPKGGAWASAGRAMASVALLWRADGEAAREILIKTSFILGCVHLIIAHLRRCIAFWPDQTSIAEIGWCLVLAAMQGVIWILFFGSAPVPTPLVLWTLGVGLLLAILFGAPSPNPAKRVGIGFASSLLPLIGAFGDTMSYIRLMAVGLASAYIAIAFNSLGATVAESATWFVAAPVIVGGHLLNIALAMIAIFAHGVRLNMLEFSNNAGVQWAGYAYSPFKITSIKES